MFCDKENVNILTSLLIAHGVSHAVICPGSRNSPIAHNLNECQQITCYPITDERSAAFHALGICQATNSPVAVCVTSGSALLNVLPAVAEAFYRHLPLVVISADRPAAWINQLDGQTLPQQGSLGTFVRKSVQLPEPHTAEERWYCNRLANEALLAATYPVAMPVHINVPITEPLFHYTVKALEKERAIICCEAKRTCTLPEDIEHYHRVLLVVGQCDDLRLSTQLLDRIRQQAVVLHESLSRVEAMSCLFDEVLLSMGEDTALLPDLVIFMGDTIVSKRLRLWLRQHQEIPSWSVSYDAEVHDTFCTLQKILPFTPQEVLETFANSQHIHADRAFLGNWNNALNKAVAAQATYIPQYSQLLAIRQFEQTIASTAVSCRVHYANSSAIRLANIYARHFVYCNRGVNGIEGSLSTAAGMSMVTDENVYCVIGDLSFFYDQNALWNTSLHGNFRILLLNNGCGGIFHRLPGLSESPAMEQMIAAHHHLTAKGLCETYGVSYLQANDVETLQAGISLLTAEQSSRPILLEVFTSVKTDAGEMGNYERFIKNKILCQENGNP